VTSMTALHAARTRSAARVTSRSGLHAGLTRSAAHVTSMTAHRPVARAAADRPVAAVASARAGRPALANYPRRSAACR
jgi:hypothetical protein